MPKTEPTVIFQDRICRVTARPDVWGAKEGEGEYAPGAYEVTDAEGSGFLQSILYQRRPLKVAGANGVTMEALIAVCIDRLEAFQESPFASPDNAEAIKHLQAANEALGRRIKDRVERGVHGTYGK